MTEAPEIHVDKDGRRVVTFKKLLPGTEVDVVIEERPIPEPSEAEKLAKEFEEWASQFGAKENVSICRRLSAKLKRLRGKA